MEERLSFKDLLNDNRIVTKTKTHRFLCRMCNRQFQTKQLCMQHLHSGHNIQVKELRRIDAAGRILDIPSRCTVCSKTFSNQRNMIRHVRSEHPEQPVVEVIKRKKVDDELKKQACPLCNKKYVRVSAVNRHIQRRHTLHTEDNQSDVIPCHFCSMTFPDENSCSKHLSQYHHAIIVRESGEHEVLICCSLCDEQFSEQSDFKQHLSGLHKKDLRECCVEVVSEPEEAENDDKNFYCNGCNLSFSAEDPWRCHMKEVHKSFPESCCKLCGDHSLKTVEELKSHLEVVHSGSVLDKEVNRRVRVSRQLQADGRAIGLAAAELRLLEQVPEWLVKHADGHLLVAICK